MDFWSYTALIFLCAFVVSYLGTGVVLKITRRLKLLDMPNARSNHKTPTPHGGGIALVLAILIGLAFAPDMTSSPVFFGVIILAVLSLIDDVRNLSAKWRLLVQGMVVYSCIGVFDIFDGSLLGGILPGWVDSLIIGIIWLWFINLYNFMDGIDGLTVAETIAICCGLIGFEYFTSAAIMPMQISIAIIAACLGFLPWNWHKAKIFMGDVGSIPLGFLLGWALLTLGVSDYWPVALILPLYYLADSGITLLKRVAAKEKIWQAHSKHFYQQAVRAGKSHSEIVLKITLANILLILSGIIAAIYNLLIGIATAGLIVIFLLYYLSSQKMVKK